MMHQDSLEPTAIRFTCVSVINSVPLKPPQIVTYAVAKKRMGAQRRTKGDASTVAAAVGESTSWDKTALTSEENVALDMLGVMLT